MQGQRKNGVFPPPALLSSHELTVWPMTCCLEKPYPPLFAFLPIVRVTLWRQDQSLSSLLHVAFI